MTSSTPMNSTLCCALLPDERGCVALTGAGNVLPSRSLDLDWDTPLEVVRAALSDEFGCRVNLLRSVFHRKPSADRSGLRVWLAEADDPAALGSAHMGWSHPDAIEHPNEDAMKAIHAWRAEVQSGEEPPFRQAWTRPGWIAAAEDWIDLQLELAGIHPINVPEQIRSWAISCLMRVWTDHGWIYFKAVPPYFACEPAATLALSRRYRGIVPDVLAADTDRGWLLLRGFETTPLGQVEDVGPWSEAFRLLARMQHDYVGRSEEIRSWRALIRPVACLPADARWLLEALPEVASHVSEWPACLTDSFRNSLPELEDRCERLTAAAVPDTLIHGDWHANNVHAGPEGLIVLDWSDTAYTHPFFDLFTMFDFDFRYMPEKRRELLSVYLDEWRRLAPDADVEEAARLAHTLSPLYHGISYARIVLNIETSERPMFASDVLRFLKLYLDRTEQFESGTCGWAAAS